MAYVTPKTDWTSTDVVQSGDLNRIEGNIEQNRADYQAGDSAEASARTAAISAEASARASADSTLQTNINAKLSHSTVASQVFGSVTATQNATVTLPAGTLFITAINLGSGNLIGNPANGYYEINSNTGWITIISGTGGTNNIIGSMVVSDGTNIRLRCVNNNTINGTIKYIKIA